MAPVFPHRACSIDRSSCRAVLRDLWHRRQTRAPLLDAGYGDAGVGGNSRDGAIERAIDFSRCADGVVVGAFSVCAERTNPADPAFSHLCGHSLRRRSRGNNSTRRASVVQHVPGNSVFGRIVESADRAWHDFDRGGRCADILATRYKTS